MDINIRPYQHFDKKACLSAFQSNVPRFFTVKEASDFDQWLTEHAFDPQTHYYVLTERRLVIACGGFGYNPAAKEVRFIWGLVDQGRHRQGFGRQLFQFRIAEIKRLYPTASIRLDTTQFSYAFFEKLGFHTDKITLDFYAPGYDRYDMTLAE